MVEVSSVPALLICSLPNVYPFVFFSAFFFFPCGSYLIEVRQRNIKVELMSVNTNQYLLIWGAFLTQLKTTSWISFLHWLHTVYWLLSVSLSAWCWQEKRKNKA